MSARLVVPGIFGAALIAGPLSPREPALKRRRADELRGLPGGELPEG